MPKVTFVHAGKAVEASEGEWLCEVVERVAGGIPFSCKAGACCTCATQVLDGSEALGAQTAREVRTLSANGLDPGVYRLPCLCDVHGDVVFGQPHTLAEAAAPVQEHQVLVESYRPLNASVAEVRFYVESPAFDFKPGQYMIFHVPNPERGLRRTYSISTPPSDRNHFEICVRAVAGGEGSNYVQRLRPGRKLKVEGPFGEFVLDESSQRDILMIATGTGISPIKSMLLHLLDKKSSRRTKLFFGVRHEEDLFYTDLCRGLASRYPQFQYFVTLSSPPQTWGGYRGRVTDLIDRMVTPTDAQTTEAYLCGGRDMIEDCRRRLLALGFSSLSIHHENFY